MPQHDGDPATRLGLRVMTLLQRQQKSVYRLARDAGIPIRTAQRICQGDGKQPSVWTIVAIAQALGVSLDSLVGMAPAAAPPAKRGRNATSVA